MTTKVQAIDAYLENMPYYTVAVMGEGLEKIHSENVRASTPWDALKAVVTSLGDMKLTQFGVLALDPDYKPRRPKGKRVA